jgi:hypothetical protein
MAALTVDEVKAYLRVQTSDEDMLIASLLASASAAIDAWMNRPVYSAERTMQLGPTIANLNSEPRIFFAKMYPIGEIIGLTDADGEEVDVADLRVDLRMGTLSYRSGQTWGCSPYTLVATVGLSEYEEFSSSIEPAIRQATMDIVSDLFQRRNPAAMSEREGGGIAVQYSDQVRGIGADNKREDLVSPRVAAVLAPWRMLGV